MLSDIDESDLCSEHSTYFSETSYDPFPLKRPKRPRRPRLPRRRPLIDYKPWPRYRNTDDIDCSRSDFEDRDSVISGCSFYESRLSRRYISEPTPSLDMVRPRKWLSSLLGLEFLNFLKKKNKAGRRKQDKKHSRERPSRDSMVGPPEDPGEEDFRRERRTTRTRYRLPRMNSDSIPELQRGRRPWGGRPRSPETRKPSGYRSRREESVATEREPPRKGRRTSPDRTFKVDRESVRAFQETTTSRCTRAEGSMPEASTSAGGRQRYLEIRMPKQGGYARPSDGPEPIMLEHRAPRPRARSPTLQTPKSRKIKERAPRINVDERSPRTKPRIVQYGVGGLSTSGVEVLTRAQSRQKDMQVRDDTWVETEKNRSTRRFGERASRPYGPSS